MHTPCPPAFMLPMHALTHTCMPYACQSVLCLHMHACTQICPAHEDAHHLHTPTHLHICVPLCPHPHENTCNVDGALGVQCWWACAPPPFFPFLFFSFLSAIVNCHVY